MVLQVIKIMGVVLMIYQVTKQKMVIQLALLQLPLIIMKWVLISNIKQTNINQCQQILKHFQNRITKNFIKLKIINKNQAQGKEAGWNHQIKLLKANKLCNKLCS